MDGITWNIAPFSNASDPIEYDDYWYYSDCILKTVVPVPSQTTQVCFRLYYNDLLQYSICIPVSGPCIPPTDPPEPPILCSIEPIRYVRLMYSMVDGPRPGSHGCNRAIFEVKINDIIVGTGNLNNAGGTCDPGQPNYANFPNMINRGRLDRANFFTIDSPGISVKQLDETTSGYEIELKGLLNPGDYDTYTDCDSTATHRGIGWVELLDQDQNLLFSAGVPNDQIVFIASDPENVECPTRTPTPTPTETLTPTPTETLTPTPTETLTPTPTPTEGLTPTPTPTPTDPNINTYNSTYILNFIDEAQPQYTSTQYGNLVGNLWSVDVNYFNQSVSPQSSRFVAAFDIDTNFETINPSQGWGEIWPSGAVGDIKDTLCSLPIPKENIIQTSRPTPESQTTFLNYVQDKIINTLQWGTFNEIKTNSPDATFILIVDDSASMTYTLVQEALESLRDIILAAGLDCVILTLCKNERWLQWSSYVLNNIATIHDPNFTDNMCACSLHFEDGGGCSVMVEFNNPYDGSIIREDGSAASPTQSWYIHPMLSSGNCPSLGSRSDPFNSEGIEILNFSVSVPSPVPNGDFPESDVKTVRAKLKCNNGTFMLDVLSNYSFWDVCDGGTGDEGATYLWNDIEIPVNGLGYPDGVVNLGDPTSIETCSNGGIELLPYNNINIKFTYIGTYTVPENPCEQYKNTVNFNSCADWDGKDGNITTVGTNGSSSYYGTYDQSGNVNEWVDGIGDKFVRGGGYPGTLSNQNSTNRGQRTQTFNSSQGSLGFRVASNSPGPSLVAIGNPGNANDSTGYGSVAYDYYIGKYEITNSDYVEFLNAIASTDDYSLYNTNMANNLRSGISRNGSDGSYSYSSKANMCNKPVNFASWLDAARYCNWLHNGKPNGSQDDTTTEDGAYTLLGFQANSPIIYKNNTANYWIPTEDEWYKAAYYSPVKGGIGSPGYYIYSTKSDTAPTCVTANEYGDGDSRVSDYVCSIVSLPRIRDDTIDNFNTKPSKIMQSIDFNKLSQINNFKIKSDCSVCIDQPTPTPTRTQKATATPTKTSTPTKTPTKTATQTNTPANTTTPTKTPTRTVTQTNTPTKTLTSTKTPTQTPTKTPTQTPTRTANQTQTPTLTQTPTKSATTTPTSTESLTPTPTQTPTLTTNETPTPTPTKAGTPTPTPTESLTPTPTPTETLTPTPTTTEGLTPTPTETLTPTPTETLTPTPTETLTPTPTETLTPTPTETLTPTPTTTEGLTPTPTPTETLTPTPTPTESLTPTPTPTENSPEIAADYIVITYEFTDGLDLDTSTSLVSPNTIEKNTCGYVGYDRFSDIGLVNINGVNDYILKWGGDNKDTGVESVLFNIKAFKILYPGVNEFILDCRTYWYRVPGSNPVNVDIKLYEGGVPIIHNRTDDTRYDIEILGYTATKQFDSASVLITTSGTDKQGDQAQRVATLTYNILNKTCIVHTTDTTTPVVCNAS